MKNKLVNLLLDHSISLRDGDLLIADYQTHAKDLMAILEQEVKLRNAELIPFERPEAIQTSHLEELGQLVERATAYIRLGGGTYRSPIDKNQLDLQRLEGEIMLKRCALRWVSTQYPSRNMALSLGIPYEELRSLYFNCCFVDYKEQRKRQEEIASRFSGCTIEIRSKDTNIKFKTDGHPHFCDGRINIPDGELFYAIDAKKTEGEVTFSIPTIFGGERFNQTWLKFSHGMVIDWKSDNSSGLNNLLSVDEFAPYLGEFGIGTNPHARITGNSFYDEKVVGTFHLALGAMYPGMESRLHMDLVKQIQGCEIKQDGRIIYLT